MSKRELPPPKYVGLPQRGPLARFLRAITLVEILRGLSLTLRHFFSRPVTRQYPAEKREPFPGARGLLALVRDSDTGEEKCVGCCLCEALCPSECIRITTRPGEGYKKVVERYDFDALRCVFCGLCVEACPYEAVVLTEHFEFSDYSREAFRYDKERLLANWDTHMGDTKNRRFFAQFWRPKRKDFGSPMAPEPVDRGTR